MTDLERRLRELLSGLPWDTFSNEPAIVSALRAAAELGAEAEREECARVLLRMRASKKTTDALACAAAIIRARGKEHP